MKSSRSAGNLATDDRNMSVLTDMNLPLPECAHLNWTLSDAIEMSHHPVRRFPLTAFNHVSREVLDLEKSKNFYVDVLGFQVIPRPPFDAEGYWLFGNNLNLHLIKTRVPRERRQVKVARIQHFSSSLPTVDHIAFLTTDIGAVREVLDSENVYYKLEEPKGTGIQQIFLFDPDGNVIEISNCAPVIGETTCLKKDPMLTDEEDSSVVTRTLRHASEDSSYSSVEDM